jgi:Mn-dependent DtxR family transcriptional regulator
MLPLARWLLVCQDRARNDDFPLTHELIAEVLGVKRASISKTAIGFQKKGSIRYKRGHITIQDRSRLEKASCECYGVVRQELEWHLTTIAPPLHQQAAFSRKSFEDLSSQH